MQQLPMKKVPYDLSNTSWHYHTLADCLSRVPIKADTIQLPILQIHQITNNLRCTADWLQELHKKTAQDDTLALLQYVMHWGWSEKIQKLPVELHPYWTFHEELTIEDGLVLKNNRIVIPKLWMWWYPETDTSRSLRNPQMSAQSKGNYLLARNLQGYWKHSQQLWNMSQI